MHDRCIGWRNSLNTTRKCGRVCILNEINLIIKELCDELGIDLTFDINKAEGYHKELILNTFYRVQAKYPLGVCLTKEINMDMATTLQNNLKNSYLLMLSLIKNNTNRVGVMTLLKIIEAQCERCFRPA